MTRKELNRMYPRGTVLELVEPINDPYSPKPAGARFKVSCADDFGQLHGRWLAPQSGSIAICPDSDVFKIVEDVHE